MTYDLAETSTAEGRPYFLYLFAEGDSAWRFTSRASAWTSPPGHRRGDRGADLGTLFGQPRLHGPEQRSATGGSLGDLPALRSLRRPLSRAARTLGATLTIYRGHEQCRPRWSRARRGASSRPASRGGGSRFGRSRSSPRCARRRAGEVPAALPARALFPRLPLDVETFFLGGITTARFGLEIIVAEAALLRTAGSAAAYCAMPGCWLRHRRMSGTG